MLRLGGGADLVAAGVWTTGAGTSDLNRPGSPCNGRRELVYQCRSEDRVEGLLGRADLTPDSMRSVDSSLDRLGFGALAQPTE
jgi:hypothetical protein